MTTPDVDPFAADPIERDQWGRPKIIPIKRGKPDLKTKPTGYTRASTFAGALDDGKALGTWRVRHAVLALGRRPDLAALAGVFGPTLDDCSTADKRALDDIAERAHDASGGNVKADHGTTVHALTEPGSRGVVPDHMFDDVQAYELAMHNAGLEVLDTEQFVVNDELTVAGTYDHRVRLTRDLTFGVGALTLPAGLNLILDKKTGSLHFDSQSVQLAVYAHAKTYNPETGERGDLDTSTAWGILAHIPKGEQRCALYAVDLTIGYAAAKLASKVMEHRKRKDIAYLLEATGPVEPAPILGVSPVAHAIAEAKRFEAEIAEKENAARLAAIAAQFKAADVPNFEEATAIVVDILGAEPIFEPTVEDKILAAATRDELGDVWREHRAEWTDQLTAALRARAAELERAA